MKTRVCFFGASVTAQKTGYVHFFKSKIGDDVDVWSFGFGSMHLADAGMAYIDQVLESKPDFCFLDWFVTGRIPSEEDLLEYLDTFRYKFLKKNCQIIFLLFSLAQDRHDHRRAWLFDYVEAYADKYSIPYINVRKDISLYNEALLFKDNVHTTDYGSELYANIILHHFTKKIANNFVKINLIDIRKTKYSEIKKIQIAQNTVIEKFLKIKGNAEIIGIEQYIGPHSGIYYLLNDGNQTSTGNLWDQWCYYERKNLKISNVKFTSSLELTISQEDFARIDAKKQCDWSVRKLMKPEAVFYTGTIESLKFE